LAVNLNTSKTAPTAADRPRSLPQTLRRWGEAMIHQQCWNWGQDIRHRKGNLLLKYGFTRHRIPAELAETTQGCTAYRIRLPKRVILVLWGFGIFYGDPQYGGMFLARYRFLPKRLEASDLALPIWREDQLPPRHTPRSDEAWQTTIMLLAEALCWIGEYERWVIESCGLKYRRECMKRWDRETIPAEHAAADWGWLAEACQQVVRL
jgi:hypothetical protein